MAKVVNLRPKSATVDLAEKLLADCKSGKVTAFAVAKVTNAPPWTGSSSAFVGELKEGLNHKLMVAAIEEMRHEFKHALRGG